MSQRTTRWLWCLLVLAGPATRPVRSVSLRTPPNLPSTVEAQAKFFQDFFSVQLSPYKIEFGHVCEDPNTWEQRYEKKDFKNHRDMGKVRWGDKQGGYGEHYWDLNHAGNAGNHGNDEYEHDDGSYRESSPYNSDDNSYKVHDTDSDDNNDPFDEPNEQAPTYEYDPQAAARFEESNRAKRAHPRLPSKTEYNEEDKEISEYEPVKIRKFQKSRKAKKPVSKEPQFKEPIVAASNDESVEEDKEYKNSGKQNQESTKEEEYHEQESQGQDDLRARSSNVKEPTRELRRPVEQPNYVPYEGGAGVRQHYQPEASASAMAARLFLEPSTGHVVDRATGQAYVLQPIVVNYN